jgi:hypothetical protein
MEFRPYFIIIPPETELNYGPSEDSDSAGLVQEPVQALVLGPKTEGAFPIRIIENGHPVGGTIYFHQPPER